MAIANIRNRIEGIHERLRRDSLNARDMANRRFTTKITIHAKEFAYAMAEAINAAADAQNLSRGIAREDEVRAATWNVIGDWSRGILELPQVLGILVEGITLNVNIPLMEQK